MAARSVKLALMLLAGASLAACATVEPRYPTQASAGSKTTRPKAPPAGEGSYKVGSPYQVGGVWYVPREQPDYDAVGVASWYGDAFHLKATANGEVFDMNAVSAAHTTLPLPSMVEVTNLENGRKLTVRVNDRGPFVGDRIIDLSHEAARQLGYDRRGLAKVRVRYLGPAPLGGPQTGMRYAQAKPTAPPPVAAASRGRSDDDVLLIAGAAPKKPFMILPSFVAPAPTPVASQALPPITGAELGTPRAPTPLGTATMMSSGLRIQAGAFANEANAERAASALASNGPAIIEPVLRDGVTLYRVLLPAPADEAQAYALRDRIAASGYAEARVIRAF